MAHDCAVGFAVRDGLAGLGVRGVGCGGYGCGVGVFGEGGGPGEGGEGQPFLAPVVGAG